MSISMSINTIPSMNDKAILIEYSDEVKLGEDESVDLSFLDLDLDLDFSDDSSSINFASSSNTSYHNFEGEKYYFHSMYATFHWTCEVRLNQIRAYLVLVLVHGFIPIGNWRGNELISIVMSVVRSIGVCTLCFLSSVPKLMDALNPTEGYPNYDGDVFSSEESHNEDNPRTCPKEPYYSMENSKSFRWEHVRKFFLSRRTMCLLTYVGFWLYLIDTLEYSFSRCGNNPDLDKKLKNETLEKVILVLPELNRTSKDNSSELNVENDTTETKITSQVTNRYNAIDESKISSFTNDKMCKIDIRDIFSYCVDYESIITKPNILSHYSQSSDYVKESKIPSSTYKNICKINIQDIFSDCVDDKIEKLEPNVTSHVKKSDDTVYESEELSNTDNNKLISSIQSSFSGSLRGEEFERTALHEEDFNTKVLKTIESTHAIDFQDQNILSSDNPPSIVISGPSKELSVFISDDETNIQVEDPLKTSLKSRISLSENEHMSNHPSQQLPSIKSETNYSVKVQEIGDLTTETEQSNFFQQISFIMQRKHRKIIELSDEMFNLAVK